jgi:hypothetical protein
MLFKSAFRIRALTAVEPACGITLDNVDIARQYVYPN